MVALCVGGDNHYGGLGAGSGPRFNHIPRSVSGLVDAIDISTFNNHTCAVRASGEVVCWGNNYAGQLGIGRSDESRAGHSVPETVLEIDNAIAVAVGDRWSCALLEIGQVACWGHNRYGILGIDPAIQLRSTTPRVIAGIHNGVAISGGRLHVCVLSADNSVKCWGRGIEGQLGEGMNINRFEPVHATRAD